MILVNLLPQELRPKVVREIHIPYRLIAAGAFLVFVLFSVYNLFLYLGVRGQYRDLEKRWTALSKQSAQADRLERELGGTTLAEVDFYNTFVDPPLEVAKVLNLISDLIPKSAWLKELRFERREKEIQLVLDGFTQATAKGSRLIEIQDFANKLKEQLERFLEPSSSAMPNVKGHIKAAVTTSVQKTDAQRTEVTKFTATFGSE